MTGLNGVKYFGLGVRVFALGRLERRGIRLYFEFATFYTRDPSLYVQPASIPTSDISFQEGRSRLDRCSRRRYPTSELLKASEGRDHNRRDLKRRFSPSCHLPNSMGWNPLVCRFNIDSTTWGISRSFLTSNISSKLGGGR